MSTIFIVISLKICNVHHLFLSISLPIVQKNPPYQFLARGIITLFFGFLLKAVEHGSCGNFTIFKQSCW